MRHAREEVKKKKSFSSQPCQENSCRNEVLNGRVNEGEDITHLSQWVLVGPTKLKTCDN